jgi:hypothetical protein
MAETCKLRVLKPPVDLPNKCSDVEGYVEKIWNAPGIVSLYEIARGRQVVTLRFEIVILLSVHPRGQERGSWK